MFLRACVRACSAESTQCPAPVSTSSTALPLADEEERVEGRGVVVVGGGVPSEVWLLHILHPGQWMLTRELRALVMEQVHFCPSSKIATSYVLGKLAHVVAHGDARACMLFVRSHGVCVRDQISKHNVMQLDKRIALIGRGFSFERMHIGSWSEEEDRRSIVAMLACCTQQGDNDRRGRRIRKLDVSVMVTDGTTLVDMVELLLPYTDSVTFRTYVPVHILLSKFFPLDACDHHLHLFNRKFAKSLQRRCNFDVTLVAYGGFQMYVWTRHAGKDEWVDEFTCVAQQRRAFRA